MNGRTSHANGLKKTWKKKLTASLIPAVPIPMHRDGRLHQAGLESYAAWMRRQAVGGAAVNVHTGRGLLIAPGLRWHVLRTWRQTMAGRLLIAGAGHQCRVRDAGCGIRNHNPKTRFKHFLALSTDMAEEARAAGADLLLVHPPTLYRGHPDRDDLIVAYHQTLARTGLPLLLFYLYEAAGGLTYTPAVLTRLFAIPGVVGIKMATLDSVITFQDVSRLVANTPHVTLVTGEDRFLGYSLMRGAHAALIGMGAACTGLQARLMRQWFHGHRAGFLKDSARVDRFAEATFTAPMEGYIQRMLWALALQRVIPWEAAHDPYGPRLSPRELPLLRRVIREIHR